MEIEIARSVMWSIGTKNWYVIQAKDGVRYQRWSHIMDATDEVMMLTQVGDKLDIQFTPVDRGDLLAEKVNMISHAQFVVAEKK